MKFITNESAPRFIVLWEYSVTPVVSNDHKDSVLRFMFACNCNMFTTVLCYWLGGREDF